MGDAAAESLGEVDFHGFRGDVEPLGDFLVGETVHVAEEHHFTTAVWQRAERSKEDFALLGAAGMFGSGGLLIEDVLGVRFGYRFQNESGPRAMTIKREVAGDSEKIRPGIGDRPEQVGPPEAAKGLLHQVVDVVECRKLTAQVAAQLGFVRLNGQSEPAGIFGRSGHYDEKECGPDRGELIRSTLVCPPKRK